MNQAIAFKSDCLGMLLKADDNGVLRDFLIVKLGEVAMFLNVGKNMSDYQIGLTVDLLLSDSISLNLTFEDYKIIIDRYLRGVYGKAYDRFDGQVFFECVNLYSEEKQSLITQANDLKHDMHLKEVHVAPNTEGMLKVAEILKETIKNVEAPKRIEKPVREKSSYEKLIQRFYRQFTKICLYGKNRNLDEGYRFIFMYGREMDATEYVELKIKQHERIMSDSEVKKWIERRAKLLTPTLNKKNG